MASGRSKKNGPAPRTFQELIFALQQYWFASLVGWSAGLVSVNEAVDQMRRIAVVLDKGIEEDKAEKSR